MRIVRPVATAVYLFLCAWTGWLLYLVLKAGQCGVDCDAGPTGLMTFAMVGAAVALAGTGSYLLLSVLFVAMAVPALVLHADEPFTTGWYLGLGFVVSAALPPLWIWWQHRRARHAERLVRTGSEAVGTVLSVDDTGLTVNSDPCVRMRFRIEPLDGSPAFEAEKTAVQSRVHVPRPGERYVVFYDPADPSDWMFGVDNPPGATPRRGLWTGTRNVTTNDVTTRTVTVPTTPLPAQAPEAVVTALTALHEQHLRGEIDATEYAALSAALLGTTSGPPAS